MKSTATKGRPRVHQSNAERQAAYRERKAAAQRQPNWRALAIELHESMTEAARVGDVTAQDLVGADAGETLANLKGRFNSAIWQSWKPL